MGNPVWGGLSTPTGGAESVRALVSNSTAPKRLASIALWLATRNQMAMDTMAILAVAMASLCGAPKMATMLTAQDHQAYGVPMRKAPQCQAATIAPVL